MASDKEKARPTKDKVDANKPATCILIALKVARSIRVRSLNVNDALNERSECHVESQHVPLI